MIRNIAARELRPFMNREDIKFRFYATREKKSDPVALTDKLCDKPVQSRDIEISNQRPDIRTAVLGVVDQVNAAGSRGGRIAVLTCGPGAMADEARAAVHHALKNGKQGLEYFEESFGSVYPSVKRYYRKLTMRKQMVGHTIAPSCRWAQYISSDMSERNFLRAVTKFHGPLLGLGSRRG